MNNKVQIQTPMILPFIPQTRAVVGFVVKNRKILLGKRLTSSTNLGIDLYAGIGGKIEKNETSKQALIREFVEEIGAKPTKFSQVGQVGFVFLNKEKESKWNMLVNVYRITELDTVPRKTESIEPMWFDIDNIPYKNMWIDNFYWVHLVVKNMRFLGEFVYRETNKLEQLYIKLIHK